MEQFLRKKLDTCHVEPNCFRIPIPKFRFEMMVLTWRSPQKMLTFTLKWGEIFFEFLELAPGVMTPWNFLNAKNEDKLKKLFFL